MAIEAADPSAFADGRALVVHRHENASAGSQGTSGRELFICNGTSGETMTAKLGQEAQYDME